MHRTAPGILCRTALTPPKNGHLHHISASLTCRLSRVSCPHQYFHVLTTSPRLPDSDGQRVFRFFHRCYCERRTKESNMNASFSGVAQASARVDVPTALHFLQCGPRSPTRVQVFVRMLGYVLVRQPTMILRVSAVKRMLRYVRC